MNAMQLLPGTGLIALLISCEKPAPDGTKLHVGMKEAQVIEIFGDPNSRMSRVQQFSRESVVNAFELNPSEYRIYSSPHFKSDSVGGEAWLAELKKESSEAHAKAEAEVERMYGTEALITIPVTVFGYSPYSETVTVSGVTAPNMYHRLEVSFSVHGNVIGWETRTSR